MVTIMQKWALLLNDQVQEITDLDPSGRYAPEFIWVPCGDDVGERDSYDPETQEFTKFELPAPPIPEIEATIEGEALNTDNAESGDSSAP